MEFHNDNGRLTITLPSYLDLPGGSQLRDAMLKSLDAANPIPVVLDIGHIERISTAAIQVILAAKTEFMDKDRSLQITGESVAFSTAIHHLGLQSEMNQLIAS